jgi:hypothetical protein
MLANFNIFANIQFCEFCDVELNYTDQISVLFFYLGLLPAHRSGTLKIRYEFKIGLHWNMLHPSTAFGHSDRKKRALTGRHNFVTSIL